jgi:hypothetical protein
MSLLQAEEDKGKYADFEYDGLKVNFENLDYSMSNKERLALFRASPHIMAQGFSFDGVRQYLPGSNDKPRFFSILQLLFFGSCCLVALVVVVILIIVIVDLVFEMIAIVLMIIRSNSGSRNTSSNSCRRRSSNSGRSS